MYGESLSEVNFAFHENFKAKEHGQGNFLSLHVNLHSQTFKLGF